MDRADERLVPKRLLEKVEGFAPDRPEGHRDVPVTDQEDGRDLRPALLQSGLELEPAHPGHPGCRGGSSTAT